MAKQFESLIAEMEQEADATRRILERVPNDKLDWQPHEKSMPLGKLARHVASIPGDMCAFFEVASLDVNDIELPRFQLLAEIRKCLGLHHSVFWVTDDAP